MERVSVALNNQIDAEEAARILGASYSHVIALVNARKLKAQRVGKKWMLDADDVYRAKQAGSVKTRKKRVKSAFQGSFADDVNSNPTIAVIRLEVDKQKMEVIRMAFQNQDKTLVQYLQEKIDALYTQIQERLRAVPLD